MKTFNKLMTKIAVISAMICFAALCAVYMLAKNNEHSPWNLFLEPNELIGSEDGGKVLAHARTQKGYIVVFDGERDFTEFMDIDESPEMSAFMRTHPGTYMYINWLWDSKEFQAKYEPIYGQGLWVYKPATN